MSDDLDRKGPEDPKKINVNQAWEVSYWCKTLGLTKSELIAAVKAVGVMVVNVKAYIAKLKKIELHRLVWVCKKFKNKDRCRIVDTLSLC